MTGLLPETREDWRNNKKTKYNYIDNTAIIALIEWLI